MHFVFTNQGGNQNKRFRQKQVISTRVIRCSRNKTFTNTTGTTGTAARNPKGIKRKQQQSTEKGEKFFSFNRYYFLGSCISKASPKVQFFLKAEKKYFFLVGKKVVKSHDDLLVFSKLFNALLPSPKKNGDSINKCGQRQQQIFREEGKKLERHCCVRHFHVEQKTWKIEFLLHYIHNISLGTSLSSKDKWKYALVA